MFSFDYKTILINLLCISFLLKQDKKILDKITKHIRRDIISVAFGAKKHSRCNVYLLGICSIR